MAERLILSVMLMLVWVGSAKAGGEGETDTLTVFETTDYNNTDIPVNGGYAHWYQKCEMIYPAEYLQGMENSNISKMAFHTGANKAKYVWEASFKIYLRKLLKTLSLLKTCRSPTSRKLTLSIRGNSTPRGIPCGSCSTNLSTIRGVICSWFSI